MFRTQPKPDGRHASVIDTVRDRRGAARHLLGYLVPMPFTPPTNGKREVTRRLRQINAVQLQVSA